ncbi:MAG: hypothetical protein MUO27_04085 [Sedimentisphaerales bacterium]|nr:hypothetical protein [Sedimentisphaerales bacterium]
MWACGALGELYPPQAEASGCIVRLKYFEADYCDVVDPGCFESLILDERVEFFRHLNDWQVCEPAEIFREVKAARVVEAADKGFGPVGIQQQFVAAVELYGLLTVFGVLKDAEQ